MERLKFVGTTCNRWKSVSIFPTCESCRYTLPLSTDWPCAWLRCCISIHTHAQHASTECPSQYDACVQPRARAPCNFISYFHLTRITNKPWFNYVAWTQFFVLSSYMSSVCIILLSSKWFDKLYQVSWTPTPTSTCSKCQEYVWIVKNPYWFRCSLHLSQRIRMLCSSGILFSCSHAARFYLNFLFSIAQRIERTQKYLEDI